MEYNFGVHAVFHGDFSRDNSRIHGANTDDEGSPWKVVVNFLLSGKVAFPFCKPFLDGNGNIVYYCHNSPKPFLDGNENIMYYCHRSPIDWFDWRDMVMSMPDWFRRMIDQNGGVSRLTLAQLKKKR